MILDGLYARLIGGGVSLALVAGGLWYVHHRGYESGVAADQAKIEQAHRERDQALLQVSAAKQALDQVNAEAAKAAAEAVKQRKAAREAIAAASASSKMLSAAQAEFERRLEAATTKKQCAVLKEVLCDSVMDY